MATDGSRNLSVVATPKMCARCGRDFGATDHAYAGPTYGKPARWENDVPRLSFREGQIVELIQQAKSNKEIAYELCLTVGTVKEYVYHIFRKLGVTNRTELALWGRDYQAEAAS
jgi:DNA-binding NarL/FixJ family response regulator